MSEDQRWRFDIAAGVMSLISDLPRGEAQYTREDNGWGVAIFPSGCACRLCTVATGMDKNVALWLATMLNMVRGAKNNDDNTSIGH